VHFAPLGGQSSVFRVFSAINFGALGINRLMAEVLEDHIRPHMLTHEKNTLPPADRAEDLIGLVRAYLK
jgi:DNA-binding FrmR family transcriptional regulator